MAVNIRKKRFDTGALRLDQVKIQFTLDGETGLPSGYNVYEQRESNMSVPPAHCYNNNNYNVVYLI